MKHRKPAKARIGRPPQKSPSERRVIQARRIDKLRECLDHQDPRLYVQTDPAPRWDMMKHRGLQPAHGDFHFNPGIHQPVNDEGHALLTYRYFRPERKNFNHHNGRTGIVLLHDGQPGRNRIFRLDHLVEDSRVYPTCSPHHFDLVYTDSERMRRLTLDIISWQTTEKFILKRPGFSDIQKNWIRLPWRDDAPRAYSYSLNPHTVLEERKLLKDGRTLAVAHGHETRFRQDNWIWGIPRGSTPWMPYAEGTMMCVFHSAIFYRRGGEIGRAYFAGALEAEDKPPYRVLRATREPIWSCMKLQADNRKFPRGPNPLLRCIFPSGLLDLGHEWEVWCGINDAAIVRFLLDKNFLEASLEPVESICIFEKE